MFIIKILLIICLIARIYADFVQQQQFHPYTPVWLPEIPPPPCPLELQLPQLSYAQLGPQLASHYYDDVGVRNFRTNSNEINFLLPYLDIDIQIEHNIHIVQNAEDREMFVLHGHEFYQLFLGRQEKRLSLMAYLEGNVKIIEPLGVEMISWQGHYLLVVALDEYFEVYYIRKDILENRAEILKDPSRMYFDIPPTFQPIQQVSIYGKLQKLSLISISNDEIMIIAAVNFSKLHGKIRTFRWSTMGFTDLEELTVPGLSVVNIMGTEASKYLITGKVIKNQAKTILNIYKIVSESLRLQNIQTLAVDSLMVHCITFQKQNLIVTCSGKQSYCRSYLQAENGYFEMFKERTAKEFLFDHLNANSRFVMASQQNKIMIFPDHQLDSYGSFTSDLTSITQLVGHIGLTGEDFVLVISKTPYRFLIRVIEIELGKGFRKTRATEDSDTQKKFLVALAEQFRSYLPERPKNFFEQLFSPPTRKKTSPNIFTRMRDMFEPPKSEEEEARERFISLFHRMVDVIDPNTDDKSSTNIFNRMIDVIQPPQEEEPAPENPFEGMIRQFGDILRPNTKREVSLNSPVVINNGQVGQIRMIDKSLKSPTEILEKVSELRQRFSAGGQREKRSHYRPSSSDTKTGNLKNHLKARKIKVKNLIFSGDIIKGFSSNRSSSRLLITNKIKTQLLNAKELVLPQSYNRSIRQFIPDLYYGLTPSMESKHLNVASINGVPWSSFYEAVFLKNRDVVVNGSLHFQSDLHIDHLTVEFLNQLAVDNLFNLRQPQVVNSKLLISRFFVKDLKADTVNGLKFEDDIVFSGRDAYVETPVTMHHLSISGDLIVADKKIERFSPNPDEMEFKQFYTNKVVINGTLVLNNVKRDRENHTTIEIDGNEFREQDIKEKYLLKSQDQHFEFPVIIDNGKITAPSLETLLLNDHPTDEHMLTDRVNSTKPLLIVFMKSHVAGDIICRDYKSKIAEIQENIIRPGDEAMITGKKRFEAPLAIDNLQTTKLNNIVVNDLIFKPELNAPITFNNSKRFEKIIVKNPCFVENGVEAMFLNNLPLEDLLNYDYHMDYINVPHPLLASNVVFHKINGIPFDEFFTKLNIRDDQLILRKDLIVEGNVLFTEPLDLQYINDIKWNEYIDSLAHKNEDMVIDGNICFYGDLTITTELQANEVNNYNLQNILDNILLKSKPQMIIGQYTFDNLKATNLDVLSINDRTLEDFVDVTKNYTEFPGDLLGPKIIVKGNVKGNLNKEIEFTTLLSDVENLTKMPGRNLKVLHNATWFSSNSREVNTQQELLKYLYKYAVKSQGNQTITGNVKLYQPIIKAMNTRLQFPPNIDLEFIADDAVKKNQTSAEYIKGHKEFLHSIFVDEMESANDIKTQTINNIDILRLNASLYRLSSKSPIQGPLRFQNPLNIGHLSLKGLVNGLNSTQIYQIQNNSLLPPVIVNQLFVDNNVQVKSINHMDMEFFLDNRVTLRGPALEVFGFLTFENVIIENTALVQTINNLHIDNMVFKHSTQLQTIMGHKTAVGSLELYGPSHVMKLNDKDLMDTYRNSLFINRNYQFDNLQIEKATFERGITVLASNKMQQQRSFDTNEEGEQKANAEDFKKYLKNINNDLSTNIGNIFYMDYDYETSIKWQKSNSSFRVDKISLNEITRVSWCEKKYLKISHSMDRREIFLENVTSNRLSAFVDKVAVKAENFCKLNQRKVRSKVSISSTKLLKVFGMKRFVETIYVVSVRGQQFVILHALDLPSLKRNEVRIFRIDHRNNSIVDWQGLTLNIGDYLKVFQTHSLTTLITNGLIHNRPRLTIYHFEEPMQKFKILQIIEGFYDIIDMVSLHENTYDQLIISCSKCQKIYIYDYGHNRTNQSSNYQIFQILSFKFNIDKLFTFSIKSDNYLMVISENDTSYFQLFKYAYIRGWIPLNFGYYPQLRMSIPLIETWDGNKNLILSNENDNIGLMILCNLDQCHLVNAVIQK
ncbi:female sterile (1) M3 [Haematobia irritans]|uniref:female sterile (1) M3 n=1 Tax=Haematobia irritans TaxID=7368 RepID=UPI003F4F47DA